MPRVTLRCTSSPNCEEETLSEYICDWPDCPKLAVHVLGVVRELRAFVAVCPEHARMVALKAGGNRTLNNLGVKQSEG